MRSTVQKEGEQELQKEARQKSGATQLAEWTESLEPWKRIAADLIEKTVLDPYPLSVEYSREKEGWDLYYDVLDELEKALDEDDPFALELKARARKIISKCRLDLGKESE